MPRKNIRKLKKCINYSYPTVFSNDFYFAFLTESVFQRVVFSKTLSSVDKWGGQLKRTKRDIRDFMILELKGIKNYKTKI